MNREDIIRMAREAGLYVAHDSEGHFSGVTNEEIIDMYQDQNKERDRLLREKIFMEVLAPFAKMVAAKEREECASVAESYEPTCDTCPSGVANAIRARREK
jgi:hypothetical protein